MLRGQRVQACLSLQFSGTCVWFDHIAIALIHFLFVVISVCVCSVLIFDVVLDMVTNCWYVPCDFSALIHVYIPSSKEICCFTCPKLSSKNWKKSLFQQLRPLPKHTTQHNSTFVLSFSRCGQEWQKYDKTNKLPLAPGTARIKDLKSTKNPTTVENSKPVGIQINSKFFELKRNKTQIRRR